MTALRLILALVVASLFSQFPAFSDQYVQRLGGEVEALTKLAAAFDTNAETDAPTRTAALADLSGGTAPAEHPVMGEVVARLDAAKADLAALEASGPLERLAEPQRFRDRATLAATWYDFKPALPISTSGLIAAVIGFALGWCLALVIGLFLPKRHRPA